MKRKIRRHPAASLYPITKGDTDNIYINSSDLGEINKIQIKHDNTGKGPGWLISEILVEDLETHATWHAKPNTWLDKFPDKTFDLSSTL